jgi:uncharacterized protein (UPF0303 family)
MSDTAFPTSAELEAQEAKLQFGGFSNDQAWALGVALVDVARARSLAITVDIRRGAQQVFHFGLEGTSADNDRWIERKVRVVERFGRSSLRVGQAARDAGTTFEEQMRLDPDTYAAHGGAFPIIVRGTGIVGVVTVSGLPQVADHELVVEVLRRMLDATGR